jgi:peptide deformylase
MLKILTAPHPLLRQKAQPVEQITDDIRLILDEMIQLMYKADGLGLAANQVGILKRMVVIDIGADCPYKDLYPLKMINPSVQAASDNTIIYEEGCLSVPGEREKVKRSEMVSVSYTTPEGELKKIEVSGLLAVCIQHEIDHLNGVLFVDRLSKLKQELTWKRYEKQHKKTKGAPL